MLVGVLAATMAALGAAVVAYAALFVRNLYKPLVPDRSERHYLVVGRMVIAVALLGAVGVAMLIDNLLVLYQYIISLPAIFGASIWLGFTWRRVTKWAVIIQVLACVALYAVIPNVFPHVDAIARNPAYLQETRPQGTDNTRGAAVLFERVARVNPADPASPRVGLGRFHAEIWVLSALGIDFSGFNKAQLVATRFFFDAAFPFVLLFLLSHLTPRVPAPVVNRFFARLHTPVQPTPDCDRTAVLAACQDPGRYESRKLVPGSQWEIMKPGRQDLLGFGGTWLLVGVVLLLLWAMVHAR
jgi:SSS family solute:Na+ symporter